MSDGRISIDVEVDGKDISVVSKQLDGIESSGNKASGGIKAIVTSLGLMKIASMAIGAMKSSLDAAISRFDTLQKYPKVLSSLGFSADDSNKSMKQLSDGIEGLPTKLDDVVATTQRMTAMTGNLNKSTQATLALNNAFLASGASAGDAQRGTVQYLQMLAKGKVDMQSWRSLQESMSVGLQKVAEDMGFTGEAATTDLYEALQGGFVTFREFQEHLISLGTGTGSLAELAKVNSEGIATSFGNLKNAVGKGVAKVIENMDNLTQKVTGKTIAQNLDSAKVIINKAFDGIAGSVKYLEPLLILVGDAFNWTADNADNLIPILMGLAAAYATLKIIRTVSAWHKEQADLILSAIASGKNLVLVTKSQMAAQTAEMGVQKAGMALTAANNGLIKVSTLLYGVMTGSISLSTVATIAMTTATTALSTALKVLTGPVGWVVAGIGALVAAGTALWNWITKETSASKKLNEEQTALKDSTDELAEATKKAEANHKDNLKNLSTTNTAYQKMADELDKLASKEKKTAADKKIIKTNVESLNKAVEGLNVAYDEETGNLNMSTKQMKARIDAFKEQETVNESQQALNEIFKEQAEIEAKLKETTELREQWNQKLADGKVKSGEYKDAIKGLDEQEQTLKATQTQLATEYQNTQTVQQQAAQAVTKATEDGVNKQVIYYETLSESQRTTLENMNKNWQSYMEKATDMFDVLSDEQKISVDEMTENLQKNQQVITDWSNNIATLANRGINEGLLAQLRDAGPESAGYVAALVGASDEELKKLSTAFENGGTTATNAFKTAFNTGKEGIPTEIMNMITATKSTLTNQIQGADFKSLGKNVTQDVVQGINEGTEGASTAGSGLAKKVDDGFKSGLDINSPSGVMLENGGYIIDGLVLGIENGKSRAQSSVDSLLKIFDDMRIKTVDKGKQITKDFLNVFSNFNSQMQSIGKNAMVSLAAGISENKDLAIEAGVYVAEQVVYKMKKALEVKSPSRVMRDKVGRFIPEGLALGITDNAQSAFDAMQYIADGLMEPIKPESVLQTERMNLANNGERLINNIYNQSFENPKISDLINTLLSNQSDVVIYDTNGLAKVIGKYQARGGY